MTIHQIRRPQTQNPPPQPKPERGIELQCRREDNSNMSIQPFLIIPEDSAKQQRDHEAVERWREANPVIVAVMTASGAELDAVAEANDVHPRNNGETDFNYRCKVLARIGKRDYGVGSFPPVGRL